MSDVTLGVVAGAYYFGACGSLVGYLNRNSSLWFSIFGGAIWPARLLFKIGKWSSAP